MLKPLAERTSKEASALQVRVPHVRECLVRRDDESRNHVPDVRMHALPCACVFTLGWLNECIPGDPVDNMLHKLRW